ncbi:MAG: TlpA family protein disulfide reductase [Vicinamibacterales bacterium]
MPNGRTVRRLVHATLLFTGVLFCGAPQALAQTPTLTAAVRAAIAKQDFAGAEQLVANDRKARGITPDGLEAMSWLGRGALAAERWDAADTYARDTYTLAVAALKGRTMDQEPHLPIAIGAAMEVRAQVAAHRGERSEAVATLQRELATYKDTSLVKRIQKNINLLSLEGSVAPALDLSESLAPKPLSLNDVKGKVVVLFFWAHWCPDCKTEAPILKDLLDRYGTQGLTVVAPTQRYGYVARGKDAGPQEENAYIEEIRATYYGFLQPNAIAMSEANHRRYGVSTTPTVVVVDRKGIVRTYHPGTMSKAELEPLVTRLLGEQAGTR